MFKQFRPQELHQDTIYKEFMTEVPKLWHKFSCDGVIRDGSGNYVVRETAMILLPVHPASFAHNFVSGMQSFYFSESQDAIVLKTCH